MLGSCQHTSKLAKTNTARACTGVRDTVSSRKDRLRTRQAGRAPLPCPGLRMGEAPEPQGRLEANGPARRFSVTAHASNNNRKRRKAGPTAQAAGRAAGSPARCACGGSKSDNPFGCKLPGWQDKRRSVETVTAAAREREGFALLSGCSRRVVFTQRCSPVCCRGQKEGAPKHELPRTKGRRPKAQVAFCLFHQLTAACAHSHKIPQRRSVLTKDTTQRSTVMQN